MASNSGELAQRPALDPDEEPSAEWGWHGSFPRGSMIAGWVVVVLMFVMLIGNHTGRTEDIWLVGVGIGLAAVLIGQTLRKRNAWRK